MLQYSIFSNKMSRILFCAFLILAEASCGKNPSPEPTPEPEPSFPSFAKGADIGWCTEMESKGYAFYSNDGKEIECTALMKECGFNSIRCRVWVNPKDRWCNSQDVLVKSLRAKELGMNVMIDFHYGDSWCDPGKQPVPAEWKGHNVDQLAVDVAQHTKEVLTELRFKDIDVKWVQVGNEVTSGMLWETCRVSGNSASNFIRVFNAGASAVKTVFPNAKVILHLDNGWKFETLQWFLDLMSSGGAAYDMLGLSLYPSYWNASKGGYEDWKEKTSQFVSNLPKLHSLYRKEIMLVEFGMPASEPQKAKEAISYIFDNTVDFDYFKGLFYWEPESEKSRNAYEYGAFSEGKPTSALDPIKSK